ncbi:MAG: ATP-binding protein [Patescibacteria group bacterium]
MKFINREQELNFLNKKWAGNQSNLIIIYGKRRVGKTELVKQFLKDKSSIYFLADKRTTKEQLKELGRLIGYSQKDDILSKRGFNDWLEVFEYLKNKVKKPFVFVVDEFPYLVETDKAIASVFQKGWDEYLKDTKIFFILLGSSMSIMESETLIYKAPLYGRRTGQILLPSLKFKEAHQFFPKMNFKEFLKVFVIIGGIPAYLNQFSKDLSLEENIRQNIFSKTEFLNNEIEFVLKEELREPKNYLSILKSISLGKRKFGEIVNETGLEKNVMNKYLSTLEKLQITEKEIPVTEKNPQKSRKGLYKITDNFFRFWFQYVFPYKSDLELENFTQVERKMNESFNILESLVYENVCQGILWDLQGKIFTFERLGRWWDKNEEIDLIGFNNNTGQIIFGECKWSNKPIGINIYENLKRKSKLVEWGNEDRKEFFVLFSKSGFTSEMVRIAKKEGVFLISQDKLLQ